jgi:hypothetical protein
MVVIKKRDGEEMYLLSPGERIQSHRPPVTEVTLAYVAYGQWVQTRLDLSGSQDMFLDFYNRWDSGTGIPAYEWPEMYDAGRNRPGENFALGRFGE